MTRPGPKPREDRSTVASVLKAIRWTPVEIAAIEAAREAGESFSACVRRLVGEAIG